MKLTDLPIDIISKIITNLSYHDITNLIITNKKLYKNNDIDCIQRSIYIKHIYEKMNKMYDILINRGHDMKDLKLECNDNITSISNKINNYGL